MTDVPVLTESLLEAEDDLQHHVDALKQATREAHAALSAGLHEQIAVPLREALAAAAERHGAALALHGFDRAPDAPARPPDVLWDALTAYRRELAEIHTDLRDLLADLELGASIGALYQTALAAVHETAESVPDALVRLEPEWLLEGEAGDSAGLIARKLTERARRATAATRLSIANGVRRALRRDLQSEPVRTQTVPLRDHFLEHADLRLPRVLAAEHRDIQTAIGQVVSTLENALTEGANGLLRLESALDLPRFHSPDVFAAPPEAEAEAAASLPAETASPEDAAPEDTPPPSETDLIELAEVRRVRILAQTLDAALHDLTIDLPDEDDSAHTEMWEALAERIRRSGFDSDRPARPGDGEPLAEIDSTIQRWSEWHHAVVRRLRLGGLLFTLRERLMAEVEELIARVTDQVITPIQETVHTTATAIAALRTEAVRACDQIDEPEALADSVRAILQQALAHIDRSLLPAVQSISLDRVVEIAVVALRRRIDAATASLSDRVTLYARSSPDQVGQRGSAAEVDLRHIVAKTLDEGFTARIIQSADNLRQPLFNALSSAEGVRDVVRYNLEAAIEELEAATTAPHGDDTDGTPEVVEIGAVSPEDEDASLAPEEEEEDALSGARELTVDGLARAEERLQQVTAPLAEPWRTFVRRATDTFESGWTALHNHANATNLVEAQLLDAKTRARRAVQQALGGADRARHRLVHLTRLGYRYGRRNTRRLVRMGQVAAGLAAQSPADRQRTLDAITEAESMHAGLPLVYRRLFALAPITDPTLQESRSQPLKRITELAERWRAGRDSSSIVITAEPGAGRTSFVNVLRATTFADEEISTLRLDGRVEDESLLAQRLSEALGVEAVDSLEALEGYLLSKAGAKLHRVCIIEDLEHLILRAPGGLDLVERAFIFMSRTDARVLWIGTMGLTGWRFVERVAPQITGLVTSTVLPPFSRSQVESALMRRHARSGLPLVFAEPKNPSALLARRLNKAESPEAKQQILQAEFFDGLYRASGPNLRLALLYWLRSADFEATADTLTLYPVEPLDFGFIERFDLPRSFALKALLQHGSLTLAEHDRIFRTTRDESFLIFESLHNLRLIQPAREPTATPSARRNGTPPPVQPVQENVRYRLHPLVVAPVTTALRMKNIL